MVKILITGGAGFVGSNLANTLHSEGHDVLVVDNLKNGDINDLNPKINYIIKDLTEFNLLELNFKAEVVYHLICTGLIESIMYPKLDLETNAGTIINVLQYAKENGSSVIYTSSGAVHGLIEREELPLNEKSKINPNNFYGLTKYVAEEYCRIYNQEYGVKVLVCRLWNVYGYPQRINHEINWIPVVTAFLIQDQPVIFGKGDQTRDFTYVEDIVDGLIKGMKYLETNNSFNVINLNGGSETSINELFEICMDVRDENKKPSFGEKSLGDVPFLLADNSKARDILDWHPRKVKDGIIDYYGKIKNIDKNSLIKS